MEGCLRGGGGSRGRCGGRRDKKFKLLMNAVNRVFLKTDIAEVQKSLERVCVCVGEFGGGCVCV